MIYMEKLKKLMNLCLNNNKLYNYYEYTNFIFYWNNFIFML